MMRGSDVSKMPPVPSPPITGGRGPAVPSWGMFPSIRSGDHGPDEPEVDSPEDDVEVDGPSSAESAEPPTDVDVSTVGASDDGASETGAVVGSS